MSLLRTNIFHLGQAREAVLAWNRWRPGVLEACARVTHPKALTRLAWLTEIPFVVDRTGGFPGGLVGADDLAEFLTKDVANGYKWELYDLTKDWTQNVDDKDYQVPFAFTGKVEKLTVRIGPSQLMPGEKKQIEKKIGERD